jgi:excisionase family DNA binding protein
MTLADYCAYYGISKATARRWIEEGRAARVPGHRHIKILRESVRLYEQRLLEGFSN